LGNSSRLPHHKVPHLDTNSEQAFVDPAGNTFPVAVPLAKAAVMALSLPYPNALHYPTLRAAAQSVMAELCAQGEQDEAQFRDALFRLVMLHGVMPTVSDRHFLAEPGERPRAHALARIQAATPGGVVSGARHVAMDMDAPGRELLTLLDGSHTPEELVSLMHARLPDSGLSLTREQVDTLTHRQLWLFARQGLMAG
jgi:hypothetical protein